MRAAARSYRHDTDFERVGAFLVRTYRTSGSHVNWLQPRWEYMHYHPLIRGLDLRRIGVWELSGEIVGVVHFEHRMGQAYFEIDPTQAALTGEMLDYAEEHLAAVSGERRELSIFVNDSNSEFQRLAADRGYARTGGAEPMAHMPIPRPFPAISFLDAFRLQSLADDNDLWKIHGVLWRGFDHGENPPETGLDDRRLMQSAPNFRHDLNVVVVTPDEEFASYCGMWFEPVSRIAYVEPVATDPRFRRLGLGSAAVREGIRRCGELGACVAYVGSMLPIYTSLGFVQTYNCSIWRRRWA